MVGFQIPTVSVNEIEKLLGVGGWVDLKAAFLTFGALFMFDVTLQGGWGANITFLID